MGKLMSKSAWYGSNRHFRTEMSYEEYKKREKRKKPSKRRTSSGFSAFGVRFPKGI